MRKTAVGILIDKQNRILLIKRSLNKSLDPFKWAIPGGKGEVGENHEKIAAREVKEETGLDFVPEKIIDEVITNVNHSCRFIGSWNGKICIQEEECDGYGWFNYKESLALEIGLGHEHTIKKIFDLGYLK